MAVVVARVVMKLVDTHKTCQCRVLLALRPPLSLPAGFDIGPAHVVVVVVVTATATAAVATAGAAAAVILWWRALSATISK